MKLGNVFYEFKALHAFEFRAELINNYFIDRILLAAYIIWKIRLDHSIRITLLNQLESKVHLNAYVQRHYVLKSRVINDGVIWRVSANKRQQIARENG